MSNENQIRIYDSTGAAPVNDPDGLLNLAQDIRFSTIYPGGLFEDASFFIPCDVTRTFPVTHGSRLTIANGLTTVWEGFVTDITLTVTADQQGVAVGALGYWALAFTRFKYNRWIDRRYSSNIKGVWERETSGAGQDKCTTDQNNRLYYVPKAVGWLTNEYASFLYTTNGSSNVKRITFSASIVGANWKMQLYDWRHSVQLWGASAAGASALDITLSASSSDLLSMRYISMTNQTPAADGTVYGRITDLCCLAETSSGSTTTTPSEIIKASASYLGSPFSACPLYISDNLYDMTTTGFVQDDLSKSIPEQMMQAGTFSASNLAYSVGVLESDKLPGNTSPIVYYEQQPSLTDGNYDYAVRLDEENMSGLELVMSSGPDVLRNEAFVRFTTDSGKQNYATWQDDANLYDATSQAKYYRRIMVVDGQQASSEALGAKFGIPYVLQKKGIQYYMRSPLVLTGTVRQKDGTTIPVAQIRAGKRIKVENFLNDPNDLSGLIFLITRTEFDDVNQTCSVTCGLSDNLATLLARQAAMNNRFM